MLDDKPLRQYAYGKRLFRISLF